MSSRWASPGSARRRAVSSIDRAPTASSRTIKGNIHGKDSGGRSLGDAGGSRRQALLWHRRRCAQSGHRGPPSQCRDRVHPCPPRRVRRLRRRGRGFLHRQPGGGVRNGRSGRHPSDQRAHGCAERGCADHRHRRRCRDEPDGHLGPRGAQPVQILRRGFALHRTSRQPGTGAAPRQYGHSHRPRRPRAHGDLPPRRHRLRRSARRLVRDGAPRPAALPSLRRGSRQAGRDDQQGGQRHDLRGRRVPGRPRRSDPARAEAPGACRLCVSRQAMARARQPLRRRDDGTSRSRSTRTRSISAGARPSISASSATSRRRSRRC
jgi:hypothetical protein